MSVPIFDCDYRKFSALLEQICSNFVVRVFGYFVYFSASNDVEQKDEIKSMSKANKYVQVHH